MPEAPVDEHHNLRGAEDEIRPTRKFRMYPVATDASRDQFAAQCDLRFGVRRSNPRHVVRARLIVVNVGHLPVVEHSSLSWEIH